MIISRFKAAHGYDERKQPHVICVHNDLICMSMARLSWMQGMCAVDDRGNLSAEHKVLNCQVHRQVSCSADTAANAFLLPVSRITTHACCLDVRCALAECRSHANQALGILTCLPRYKLSGSNHISKKGLPVSLTSMCCTHASSGHATQPHYDIYVLATAKEGLNKAQISLTTYCTLN